jgi:DNA-nicking Smr family endonuclease
MSDENTSSEILHHMERFGVINKDARLSSARDEGDHLGRRRGRRSRFDETIDLHGMTQDRAAIALRAALRRCSDLGKKTLLVIHGVGHGSDPEQGPVLRHLVKEMLDEECGRLVRDYRAAMARDGGDGATVVRIR